MNAIEKYQARVGAVNSLVCVGLDSDIYRLPERFLSLEFPQLAFNQWIIEQTHELVAAYKPNIAFYEARGAEGLAELQMTMDFLRSEYPEIVTICDAKRADIGSTNEGYVKGIFDTLGFDMVTLHPYLGQEALEPFLARKEKGCIILCRTSNPGAGELQDLEIDGKKVWQIVAQKVRDEWNEYDNCLLVVGATYPEELAEIRKIMGDMTFLVPGIGAQGGDVEKTVKAGLNSQGGGMIINSSRGIILSQDPRAAAASLREQINQYR